MLITNHITLHTSASVITLYSVNVVSALLIYCNALVMVLSIPFQSVKFNQEHGPTWLYVCIVLIIIFQYYLWALEMSGFWFKSELNKIELLM